MVNNHITLLHILAFHIIKGKKSVFHTYLSKHYSVLFTGANICTKTEQQARSCYTFF